MLVAATKPCDDFPAPNNPADLAPFYSDQTSSSSEYDEDGNPIDETTTDGTETTDPAAPTTDADGDGYPDGAYAPGVQLPDKKK